MMEKKIKELVKGKKKAKEYCLLLVVVMAVVIIVVISVNSSRRSVQVRVEKEKKWGLPYAE